MRLWPHKKSGSVKTTRFAKRLMTGGLRPADRPKMAAPDD